MTRDLARLADLVGGARRPVAFTGAGVSTESGIPDFRSPGGVWDRYDPAELTYRNFIDSVAGRRRYWAVGREVYPVIRAARPNRGHRALAALHAAGRLDCCITQNVDGLHQRAGLPDEAVVELHGNAGRVRCLSCHAHYSRDQVHRWLDEGVDVPACPGCGGIVKPETVLFGEAMPRPALAEAERRARAADVFVVVGSSLAVYPAGYLPRHAREAGATLVVVNLARTPLDRAADLVLRMAAGDALAAVAAELGAALVQEA